MVARRALVQAAPLGGGALVAALTGAPHLGVALRGETRRSALGFMRRSLFAFLPQMWTIVPKVVQEEGSCAAVHPRNTGTQAVRLHLKQERKVKFNELIVSLF